VAVEAAEAAAAAVSVSQPLQDGGSQIFGCRTLATIRSPPTASRKASITMAAPVALVGAAISEICGSCKETPRSNRTSSLLCGAGHIMSGIHRKRRSIKMQSTQQAMREASRPESVAGNAAPAR